MEYSLLIISSNNIQDYYDGEADGIRYNNLSKEELETLMNLSLRQNFSVIVQKNEKEE